jgi:tRNA pseudouridine55 synthase
MAGTFHGLLVLDKPGGLTSRAALDRAARWFPRGTRVGHTGTLDPLATGVLVLCVGAATRLAEYVQRMTKVYRAGIRLGARSDTDDADGTLTPVAGAAAPDPATLAEQVRGFVGEIEQVPPAYSAVKLHGRRACDLARRGREVGLTPRRVRIDAIDVLAYAYPDLELEVRCGKGTYIRSLARDLGERLGCGAYLRSLRRTRVGPFAAADGLSLDADEATARSRLLPPAAAVSELPRVTLGAGDLTRLRQGQRIPLPGPTLPPEIGATEVAVIDVVGALAAVGAWDPAAGVLRPVIVLEAFG